MNNGDNQDLERRLKSLKLTPAPAGLREKVLIAARQKREVTVWTTPLLRKCLAGCAVLLAVIFITDASLSRNQRDRLQALLEGPAMPQHHRGEEDLLLAEVLGDVVGPTILATKEMANALRTHVEQVPRVRILRELLKEDFFENEPTKDLH